MAGLVAFFSFFTVVLMLSFFICALLASGIASSKGRDQLGWFLLGLFFGPIGLIAAGLVESIETTGRIQALQGYKNKYFIKCKFCSEVISTGATFCHFCGNGKDGKGTDSKQDPQSPHTLSEVV